MTGAEGTGPRPSPKAPKLIHSSRKLLAELVEQALQPLTSLVQQQSARIDALQRETVRLGELAEGRAAELGNMIVGLQQRTETETFETGNRITHFYQALETQIFELSNLVNGDRQAKLAELSTLITAGQQATESKLSELSNLVVGEQQRAEASAFELSNVVVSGQQAAESRAFELSNIVQAAGQAADASLSELSSRMRDLVESKAVDSERLAARLEVKLAEVSDLLTTGQDPAGNKLSEPSDIIKRGQETAEEAVRQLSARIKGVQQSLEAKLADLTSLIDGSREAAERTAQTAGGKISEIADLVGASQRSTESRLFELLNAITRARDAVETGAFELSNLVIGGQQAAETKAFELSNLVLTGQQAAETKAFELSNLIYTLQQNTESRLAEFSNRMRDLIRNSTFELDNSVGGVRQLLDSKTFELGNLVVEIRNGITAANQLTETRAFESFNLLHDLNNRLTHLLSVIANVKISLLHQMGERFQHRDIESVQRLLAIEAALRADRATAFGVRSVPRSNGLQPFDSVLARAKQDFPRQFADWLERLKVFEDAVQTTPIGNLANWSDPYSHAFKSFVEARAVGSILDVGCGQFERPIYLSGFPKTVIHGLDPLPAQTEFDFPVARGIGEYLPWEDASFDTLISATAIDHTLSLDRALAEMERVLAADGRILMWVGSVPGAKRYEPEAPEYAPADKFHLFHIDRAWFEPMLEERFVVADRLVIWTPAHEHVFYMLTKKRRSSEQPALAPMELETGAARA